ncbi:hypothetical protein DAPPUDRAFT_116759 [Daphnia pulex]|uniref:Uncharacterized protein n=1 Tax=Daphnia pulex TaxID=6669 RepID=E9HQE8_DAPPU|nr:hypothetical protein DAPPUDRAFT_116759 [Daphnia pulex]|eukprot:EFX66023.1 hypothetical protein DAPPUDRAFT_116759 [Daphnia pulex]
MAGVRVIGLLYRQFRPSSHRKRPLVEALHKKINMANCRQHSCYPSSDFSNPYYLSFPLVYVFISTFCFLLANRPPLFVAGTNFYEGKSVDPLAESLDCSQAKKGGPKIHNPFADCNKGNCKALASKSSNNGGTSKQTPILEIGSLSFPKLQTMVHINLASPRNHFEMINSINQMDQNVTVSIIC